jgi:transposase
MGLRRCPAGKEWKPRAGLVAAPEPLRTQLRGLPLARLVATAAAFRAEAAPPAMTKLTLRLLAQRHRQRRRRRGKSDPADAEAAARAVLTGEATAVPKARGVVESIRVLQVARASAVQARTQVADQRKAPAVTAPDALRRALLPLPTARRVARCAELRPGPGAAPREATERALRHLARRWQHLDAEVRELDADLAALTRAAAPRLLARPGVGPGCAARLLVAAGDNPARLPAARQSPSGPGPPGPPR